jgi:hypothetical protein
MGQTGTIPERTGALLIREHYQLTARPLAARAEPGPIHHRFSGRPDRYTYAATTQIEGSRSAPFVAFARVTDHSFQPL